MIKRSSLSFILFFFIVTHLQSYDLSIIKSGDVKNYDKIISIFVNYTNLSYKIFNVNKVPEEKLTSSIAIANPKAIFVIGAKAAVFALKNFPGKPIIYSMVKHEEIFSNVENIAGVKGAVSTIKQMKVIRETFPNISSIGILYTNKTKKNTMLFRDAGVKLGIKINTYLISSKSQLNSTLRKLYIDNDAFYLQLDPMFIFTDFVKSAIVKSIEYRKPVITFSPVIVKIGAVMAADINYGDVAKKAALITNNIVSKGIKPIKMKNIYPNPIIYLNLFIARKLGIQIPDSVVDNALIIKK